MYLSKLVLNLRNQSAVRDLSNSHALHQRIMHAFPDEQERKQPRQDWHILFRQEPDSEVILVQSELEPDWSKLPSDYLAVGYSPAVKEFAPDPQKFDSGKVLQFRLRANPSKRDRQTKKTIGVYRREEQLTWLERQAERNGFILRGVDVIPSPNLFGQKKGGTAPIRIVTALYQGVLEISDSDKFLQALHQGIGRAKSYGCGLLSVARLN
jgi:CRISPR system Cascade subunit CasE